MPKLPTLNKDTKLVTYLKKLRKHNNTCLHIGIVGSRRRDNEEDYETCLAAFTELLEEANKQGFNFVYIVSGGCLKGADRFAEKIAKDYGCSIVIHYPSKNLDQQLLLINPRAAYAKVNYARNTLIAEDSDILLALPASDRTGGTEDTIKKSIKRDRYVKLV